MRPLDPEVLPHLVPARRPLAVVVGAGIVGGVLTIAQAWAIGALVVRLVSDPAGDAWHPAAVALLATVGLRTLVEHVGTLASARAAARVSTALRHRLLAAATARPAPPGADPDDLVLLATRGATSVEPYVTRYLPALVLAATLPALTVAAIWWLDRLSGLIVLLTLPLVPVFAALVGMTTRDRAARQWGELGVLSGHFLDVARGLPTLVAHRRAEAQVARIGAVTERYRRATVDTLRLAFASSSVLELVATLSVALVAVSVGLRLADATIGFETALVVLLLAPEAYWPLRRVGAEFHSAAEGTAALTEASAALAALEAAPHGDRVPASLALRLDDLAPGHRGSPHALTRPLALDLPDRGVIAVAGASGCGKSTLLQTLRGELAPYAGRVLVGGVDLAAVDPDWWRRQVAWLPQRPWLAAGTVRDNLRLGDPDATDDSLWRALRAVGMDDVVAAHPGGLDRLLGEDGAGLSAGQRARVAMARVLVADRPVVLLDEPTAHLDDATEQVLLDAVQTLAERALVVVVAHREAVLASADLVVELLPRAVEPAPPVPVAVPPTRPVATQPDDVAPPAAWAGPLATVLGVLSTASGVALTATAAWLITRASTHPPVLVLMVAIVGVRTFGIARPVLRHAERLLSHDVVLHELAARRTAVYAALVPLVPGALRVAGPRRGDLLTSIVDDVDSLLDARLRVRQPVVTALAVGLLSAVLAWWWAPQAGVAVAALVAVGVLAGLLGRHGARLAEPAHLRHRARLSTLVEEVVAARDELSQWQAAEVALDVVDAEGEALGRAVRRSVRAVAAGHAAVRLATGAAVVGVAAAVPAGAVSPATLALLVLLPVALGEVVAPLADAGALSVRTDAARQRLDRLTALSPLVSDPAAPAPLPPGPRPVAVEGVSAGWGPDACLRDLDVTLRPGERVAVCGPSGSGKSTLASLLVRHLDPSVGAIRLGGVDLRDVTLDDVRRHVGLAADDPHVFASSVCENVRLARPGATDAEVADALGRARLGAWVASLPQGMHTLVGAAGVAVSGGERARIGVARALLADAPVLVLDEPTAHLDTATAREVADVLLAGRADRTVVWITHGSVGLDRVDRVVALDLPEVKGSREQRVAAPA